VRLTSPDTLRSAAGRGLRGSAGNAQGDLASPLEIGFNSIYLVDILTHLDSEHVRLSFSAPTRAALVSPVQQPDDEDVIMLVMPVRLNT
jgi:DNA polymerase III sliding clamp (beta) subunit (PCNA family)